VPPISACVAAGLEHSVANMYFVPLGLFVATFDPEFTARIGLAREAGELIWMVFVWRNLLPVTVGNIIGGTLLVGAVYRLVYRRHKAAAQSEGIAR
jgi:formate/nitrite transporter FocA (FNT family)